MMSKKAIIIAFVMLAMGIFFLIANPVMMDDGFHYEGFAEALARGELNFKDYYGFQGLSFFAVPIYWLTHSKISIIITSMILSLLSIPLVYGIGKKLGSGTAGVMIFLLTPYPYMTMMRGFQEAALLFFILLVIYGALHEKTWTGLAWGIGAIVKPFALVLLPLFKLRLVPLVVGLSIMGGYGIFNYVQTGHFVNLAATGAYEGVYDPSNVPAFEKSFVFDWKTWARTGANFLVHTRKIMVSPLAILIGAWALWSLKTIPLRRRIILAVVLNILLVGPITYAFPKYLLPATTLLSFAAIPLLVRYAWLWPLVLIDSIFVFLPNYNFFGHVFWPSPVVAFLPLFLAVFLCLYENLYHYSNSARA